MSHVYRFVLTLLVVVSGSAAWAGVPTEWSELDDGLDRPYLIRLYNYRVPQPADPIEAYCSAVRYSAPIDSLGSDAWAGLSQYQQDRRTRAAQPYHDLMASNRQCLVNLYQASIDPNQRFWGLLIGGATLVIESIGHLVNIVGLTPEDAGAWFDLAYFAGCVGDVVRQEAALRGFIDLYDEATGEQQAHWHDRRVRAALDLGWLARERGDSDGAQACVLEVNDLLDDVGRIVPGPMDEAYLVAALSLAERGEFDEARTVASRVADLPFWRWSRAAHQVTTMNAGDNPYSMNNWVKTGPTDNGLAVSGFAWAAGGALRHGGTMENAYTSAPAQKNAWYRDTGAWARRWVDAVIAAGMGEKDRALEALGDPDPLVQYPPHLNHRLWNDRGRIHEQFGEHDPARLCYAQAAILRPLFVYYPLEGRRGRSTLYADPAARQVYYLGGGQFYTSGDRFAHAAMCLLAYEFAEEADLRAVWRDLAEDGLTACRRRGIQPTAALAQRGRLHFLSGDLMRAETDLTMAHEEMRAAGEVDPDLVLILGLTLFNAADFAGAVPWLEHFCRLKPEMALGWQALGLAALQLGHLDVAESSLARAAQLAPENPNARFNHGLVAVKRGDQATARREMEAARKLVPNHPDINRIADLVAEGELPDLNINPSPIELQADEASRQRTLEEASRQRVSLLGELGIDDGLAAAGRDTATLKELEQAFLRDPNLENRTRLAARHQLEGDHAEVRRLLEPVWDEDLAYTPTMVLLHADRAVGDARRARALAHNRDDIALHLDRPELWMLAGVICRENGEDELGLAAIAHADALLAGTE